MKNEIRRWVKQEKRIVKLLYKKGFLTDFKIEELYWSEYKWLRKKCYKGKRGYKFPLYMPEIHFGTTDYWGEGDEHSLVDSILENIYWEHIDYNNWDETSGEYPKSTMNLSRIQLLKYLKGLPIKINDNKIKKILNRSNNYE